MNSYFDQIAAKARGILEEIDYPAITLKGMTQDGIELDVLPGAFQPRVEAVAIKLFGDIDGWPVKWSFNGSTYRIAIRREKP